MGLLRILTAPVGGVIWVAERVQEEAERQYYDPGLIRRKLEEIAEARERGDLGEQEAADMEKELVGRLLESRRRPNDKDGR